MQKKSNSYNNNNIYKFNYEFESICINKYNYKLK